jgi:hypothetical protein
MGDEITDPRELRQGLSPVVNGIRAFVIAMNSVLQR